MSGPELASELAKRREELFRLRFNRSSAVKNPLRERTLRREIASIATWMNPKARRGA